MLLTLMLSAALTGQVPPAPPAAPPPAAPAPPEAPEPPEPPVGFDTDGDGIVTREEFVAPLADAFARLDADGDGRLSSEEFAGADRDFQIVTRSGRGPGIHRFQLRREVADAIGQTRILDGEILEDILTGQRIVIRRHGDRREPEKHGGARLDADERVAIIRELIRDRKALGSTSPDGRRSDAIVLPGQGD